MSRQVSNAETARQIAREGKRWGLVPMTSTYGSVLVAEDAPCAIPLPCGLCVVVPVRRDLVAMTQDYPWTSVLRGRRKRIERSCATRREVALTVRRAEILRRKEDIFHEMAGDIRRTDKGRIILLR